MKPRINYLLFDILQNYHSVWLEDTFPDNTAEDQFYGMVEELGELSRARLKTNQHVEGYSAEECRRQETDAIGDLIMYLCGYCSKRELVLSDCVKMALTEIITRDWGYFKATGKKRYIKRG